MKSVNSKRLISLLTLLVMLSLPMLIDAQRRTRPRLRRAARRTTTQIGTTPLGPIVPIGTNLKIRIEDTLSSKDSRVSDRFTATALDTVIFNDTRLHARLSSMHKSGR